MISIYIILGVYIASLLFSLYVIYDDYKTSVNFNHPEHGEIDRVTLMGYFKYIGKEGLGIALTPLLNTLFCISCIVHWIGFRIIRKNLND